MGWKQDGCQVWKVHSHAQHVPNNRCTNQSHLLSISLTYSLEALPAAPLLTAPFCPFKETNPPPSTGPWPSQNSRVQLAGHMVTEFCLKKQWTLTFLSQVSRLQHSSQAHCCSLHPLLAMTSSTSHLRSMMESLPLTE